MSKHTCVTFNCNNIDHINERLMKVENKLDYLNDTAVELKARVHTIEQRIPHRSEDALMALKKDIGLLETKIREKAAISGVVELYNNHKDAIERLNKRISKLDVDSITVSKLRL